MMSLYLLVFWLCYNKSQYQKYIRLSLFPCFGPLRLFANIHQLLAAMTAETAFPNLAAALLIGPWTAWTSGLLKVVLWLGQRVVTAWHTAHRTTCASVGTRSWVPHPLHLSSLPAIGFRASARRVQNCCGSWLWD